MTQEEKELLLKDLCARLPYGIWFQSYHSESGIDGKGTFDFYIDIDSEDAIGHIKSVCDTNNNKPYLRPMSSMTEEEIKDFGGYINTQPITHQQGYKGYTVNCSHYYTVSEIDWLNERHFDYRGLIPLGLAIAVTEENNPYKR